MITTVLYENDDVLVVDKPAGLVVHSDGRTKEPTLVDWLLKYYPSIKEVGGPPALPATRYPLPVPRPGIVHRLDRETSGAMVIAKTPEAFLHLKRQFQKHLIQKRYHAFVYGILKQARGIID